MKLTRPKRVFLDSWVLKRLSRGNAPETSMALRQARDKSEVVFIVTHDHVEDFCHDGDRDRAEKEAAFVDTLTPAWMPPGAGIYHREAYAELLRLTTGQAIDVPWASTSFSGAIDQWVMDCPCDPTLVSVATSLSTLGDDPSFLGKVRGTYDGDLVGLVPTTKQRRMQDYASCANRASTRSKGLTDEEWDRSFRKKWVGFLTEFPAAPPEVDVEDLSGEVNFSRMKAWTVWIAVEKRWHKDRSSQSKPSDTVDMRHLALLPYVDIFVTEKHLAELIRQSQSGGLPTRVFADLESWVQEEFEGHHE